MLTCFPRILAGLLVFAFVLRLPEAARGASPEPGDPTYHNLRYDDDFSYLADASKATSPWDAFKYIPLGNGKYGASYLSFGGELRLRAESYLNPNFGIKAPPSNGYLLQRLLLNADVHLTDYVRIFLQLGEMERIGDRGTPSTTDINQLDIMQAFIDLRPPSPLGDAPIVRIGREELLFGYQRLIAVREGPNIRRDFDGFRFHDNIGGASVDVIAARPVSNAEGVFDDHTNMKQYIWGPYVTVPLGKLGKADIYELNYENESAKYRGLTGTEQRATFGFRLFGEYNGFDWNAEFAGQRGTFRNLDVRADMLAGIFGYTFRDALWEPRIGIESNFATGDNIHSRHTLGTFNAMYPRLPYFAETSLLVPANVYDIRPVLSVKPAKDVLAVFGWDTLWRASITDGLYGSGMVQYPGTAKVTGMRVGTELSADVRWRVNRHLLLGAIFAEFLSGPAVTEALGKNVSFFVLFATFRF
jgi:hypothetical protein